MPVTNMKNTCTSCRSRKMRCDAVKPTCGPCSRARTSLECQYIEAKSMNQGPKASLLQKGAACLGCRRKKKKCDARRPICKTCQVAGKGHECVYDDDVRHDMTASILLRNRELEERVALLEAQQQQPTPFPQFFIESQSSVTPDPLPSPVTIPGMHNIHYVLNERSGETS
ncbi:hypothetical protein BC835DRAFT_1344319 [Cytidiella melzeri]|nr:hypothetical protein BC835DRAFT_1344319 [Cytidiella melzeri]